MAIDFSGRFLTKGGSFMVFVATLLLLGGCVTNRKYQLMQKNDVNKQDNPSDSVVRSYAVESFDYRIQTNDILSVRFETLSPKEYDFLKSESPVGASAVVGGALLMGDLVDEQGNIPFPVVGKARVSGLTVYQAQDTLQKIANQYLESPIVKVRLLNYRITLLGEVNREGTVIMNNNRVNFLEAIGLAGGLTDLADKANIKLLRQKGGKTEVIYLNIQDENFIRSPYYYVYQNDVLIVPALRQRPYRKYFGQNLTLFLSSLSLLILVLNYSK